MAESEDEAGCSGQGPACIINMYGSYGDYEGMDRSLESFIRYHPDYDPNLDPELPYEQWSTVGMAQMRVGCNNGNGWACAGMVIIAGFSSPLPVIIQPAGSAPQNYGNDPADPDCPGCGFSVSGNQDTQWVFGNNHSSQQWQNKMAQRGWTVEQITETIRYGESYPAVNLVHPDNPATRYVNPDTGRSVVIDNVTHEIIHIGGDGYGY